MFPGLCLHIPRKKKVWVPFQVAIKSSPVKSWSFISSQHSGLLRRHQECSSNSPWGDRPWGYPKWLTGSGPRGWPLQILPGFPLFLSSCPAAEKSPAPCASKRGPCSGLRGEVPAGQTPSTLHWLCRPHPASLPGPWTRGPEGWARVGEPRGLHRTVERAKTYRIMIEQKDLESLQKIRNAWGFEISPFFSLVERCQGPRPYRLAVCLFKKEKK